MVKHSHLLVEPVLALLFLFVRLEIKEVRAIVQTLVVRVSKRLRFRYDYLPGWVKMLKRVMVKELGMKLKPDKEEEKRKNRFNKQM